MRAPFPKPDLRQWAKEMTDWLNERYNELRPVIPLLGRRDSGAKGRAGLIAYNTTNGQVQVFTGTAWCNSSRVPAYAFADLPLASSVCPGTPVFITNGAYTGGVGAMAYSDGTVWRRYDTGATAGT